jgi:hypothetical protein
LSRNEWRVSDYMLSRLQGGHCVDSVDYIARGLQLSRATVHRARRKLLVLRLWMTARQRGTRDATAPYFPDQEKLRELLSPQPI